MNWKHNKVPKSHIARVLMVLSGLISLRMFTADNQLNQRPMRFSVSLHRDQCYTNWVRNQDTLVPKWTAKRGWLEMAGIQPKSKDWWLKWLNFLVNTGYLIFVGKFKPNSCAATTYYKICGLAAYLSQFQPVVSGWEQQSQTAKETTFQKIGCRAWSKFQGDCCLNPNKTHGMCWWNYHIE